MDIIDNLIALAQISGGININCRLQGTWQLDNPQIPNQAVAHIVAAGSAYLHTADGGKRLLQAGDVAFFARAQSHSLSSEARLPATAGADIRQYPHGGFTVKEIGSPNTECDLFCLHFHYAPDAALMAVLPDMLVLPVAQTPLRRLVELLKSEAETAAPAAASVVNALSLVVLTLIVRQYLLQADRLPNGILKGWQEERLRPILARLLSDPARPWSLADMMAIGHLSRSGLIRLFKRCIGSSPHHFVRQVRLQKAAMLLRQSSDPVLAVALACGFQSETHFNRVFKSAYDTTPGAYRRANPPDGTEMPPKKNGET